MCKQSQNKEKYTTMQDAKIVMQHSHATACILKNKDIDISQYHLLCTLQTEKKTKQGTWPVGYLINF